MIHCLWAARGRLQAGGTEARPHADGVFFSFTIHPKIVQSTILFQPIIRSALCRRLQVSSWRLEGICNLQTTMQLLSALLCNPPIGLVGDFKSARGRLEQICTVGNNLESQICGIESDLEMRFNLRASCFDDYLSIRVELA